MRRIVYLISSLLFLSLSQMSCADNSPAAIALTPGGVNNSSNDGFATPAAPTSPMGCTQGGFNMANNTLNLTSAGQPRQRVYLINNVADYIVVINRVTSRAGMNAGWVSRLDSGSWSALAMDSDEASFNCMARREVPPSLGYVSCAEALKVCVVVPANQGNTNGGSYWVAENQNLGTVMQKMKEKGFLPAASGK